MGMKSLLAASAAAIVLAGTAQAGTINVTSVVGTWTSITGGTLTSGIGTNEIRWGADTGSGQSGYDFTGLAPSGPWDADDVFDLGIFKHINQPISAGTSITKAVLNVVFGFSVTGDPTVFTAASTFVINHNETPNGANPCADGGANGEGVNINGCADNVDPVTNPATSTSFEVGGVTYLLDVTGFDIGSSFWTTEQASNTARIQARFTEKENVPPIPLPAAGWLLIAGLGGLAAVARRRKAAA